MSVGIDQRRNQVHILLFMYSYGVKKESGMSNRRLGYSDAGHESVYDCL